MKIGHNHGRNTIRNRVLIGTSAAAAAGLSLILAMGGGQESACASPIEARAAAVAQNFGGVALNNVSCPPSSRGLQVQEVDPGGRNVVAFNPQTGADISALRLFGAGQTGFISVPEVTIGNGKDVGLRSESLDTGQVLGQTTANMNCVVPTTLTPSTTAQPSVSIPGGEQGHPVNSTSTTLGKVIIPQTTTTLADAFTPNASNGFDVGSTIPGAGAIDTSTSIYGGSAPTIGSGPTLNRAC